MLSTSHRLLSLAMLFGLTTSCRMDRNAREPSAPMPESAGLRDTRAIEPPPGASPEVTTPEPRRVPSLADALPTEELLIAHEEGAIGWYLYRTDLDFETLRRMLLDFLGDDWSVAAHDRDAETQMESRLGVQGITGLGVALFENHLSPSITISLHLFEEGSGPGHLQRVAHVLASNKEATGSRSITMPELLRTLAESGDRAAQERLAFAHHSGQFGQASSSEAIRWWRKAAEQGSALAQFSLGTCYYVGHGVLVNDRMAVSYFRRAAAQEFADAQYSLGVCYDLGRGVEKDSGEAAFYFRRAAYQGLARAQFNLGTCYYLGDGVSQDPVYAYAWLTLSKGNTDRARAELAHLEEELTTEQLADGRRLSEELAAKIRTDRTRAENR